MRPALPAAVALLFAPLAVPIPATAAPAPGAVGELFACTSVADPTARLACLDKATAALQAATTSGELIVVEKKAAEETERRNFGRTRRPAAPGASVPTQEVYEVAAAARGQDRHWLIVLKDGGSWRLTDDELLAREPKAGSRAKISKGSFGGYFIELDGQSGVRASRLD